MGRDERRPAPLVAISLTALAGVAELADAADSQSKSRSKRIAADKGDSEPCDRGPERAPEHATDLDTDLALVNNAWHELPDAVRIGIVAMVRAAR